MCIYIWANPLTEAARDVLSKVGFTLSMCIGPTVGAAAPAALRGWRAGA